jgi:hypothetical protein
MAKDDTSLKRLGGGRWETRDGRFAIEPQSGTWVIVDAESTDEMGLPLVRGPYPSLTAAKEAIASARTAPRAASPLARKLDKARTEPAEAAKGGKGPKAAKPEKVEPPPPPPEPKWLTDLQAPDRRRAREVIARLSKAGLEDAEDIARDEIARGRPAVARAALARRLRETADAEMGPEAVRAVLAILLDGSDRELGVRWRLVDGDGRAIGEIEVPE